MPHSTRSQGNTNYKTSIFPHGAGKNKKSAGTFLTVLVEHKLGQRLAK